MQTLQINDDSVVDESVKSLLNGGLVMHPTETCYGLAVDIFNESALKKLYRVKGRDADKPVSILVDGLGMAMEYGIFSEKALELAHEYWPGPLSIVVPRTKTLPDFLNPGEEFISIRYSSDTLCEALPAKFGSPITTTSANLAGQDPLYEADMKRLGKEASTIDLVIDGGILSENKPSTVVKVEGDHVDVLRHGDITFE
ncbi:threonylcarbamoyl-AMP synthase [Candidatus Peregrinibacteria bacterium]|jgi:L-threonylcarbamoyladenylate synthase|nr:threonylcarbamoyl-AMP synthase [Candidatus Peregrinibacteria bacterium]